MSLTIKNPEALDAVRHLAEKLEISQTAAITRAALESLARLNTENHKDQVDAILQEIWASQSSGEYERIQDNLDALYGEDGLPQ